MALKVPEMHHIGALAQTRISLGDSPGQWTCPLLKDSPAAWGVTAPGPGGASMVAAGQPPRSAGWQPISPAASGTQKQTRQNLVSRHNFTITDIINIKPNKPPCALPRRERCLQDAPVGSAG